MEQIVISKGKMVFIGHRNSMKNLLDSRGVSVSILPVLDIAVMIVSYLGHTGVGISLIQVGVV